MGLSRDFLKGLDLDKSTIDSIMSEYGSSVTELKEQIEKQKADIEEAKKGNAELATLQTANKDFEKKVKDLEKQVGDLTTKNQDLEKNGADNLKALKKDYAIKKAILKTGAVDEVSYKAHLDISKIEYDEEKDELTGFEEQDKAIKENHSYLFGSGKATGGDHGGIKGNGGTGGEVSLDDAIDEKYGN